jgi:hypothetical protein
VRVGTYEPLPVLPPKHVIAETLSDMDAEITALKGKLSTGREVKAGMMSVLLTGRIRLVEKWIVDGGKRHGRRNLRAGRETVQGTAGQGGDDVRVVDGQNTISGKLRVESGKRHGRRNRRAGRETVQGAGGQGGDDVRVTDG